MAKRTSRYASMNTSELLKEMRDRNLQKPEGITNISELADFLEAEDAKAAEVEVPKSKKQVKAETEEAQSEPKKAKG